VSPANNDFHLDLRYSGEKKDYARPIGIAVAAAVILLMLLTMTTSVASKILPMTDEYLLVMIPPAPDGGEALAIKSLMHEINEKTIYVSGSIMNRANTPMSNIHAVVEMQDTTGRFPQTLEVPVQPDNLPPQGVGNFMAMATLQENPGAYIVRFRFADGPFIPHRDDRAPEAPEVTITPQQKK
jgi:hypothetical protein